MSKILIDRFRCCYLKLFIHPDQKKKPYGVCVLFQRMLLAFNINVHGNFWLLPDALSVLTFQSYFLLNIYETFPSESHNHGLPKFMKCFKTTSGICRHLCARYYLFFFVSKIDHLFPQLSGKRDGRVEWWQGWRLRPSCVFESHPREATSQPI